MSDVSCLLDPRLIDLDVREGGKREVIRGLVRLLEAAAPVRDAARLTGELLARERLSSTAIGEGVAIPHVLSDTVDAIRIVFGRSRNGVDFDAPDRKPVRLIFLITGPAGNSGPHLKLLSKLARLLRDPEFRSALTAAATPEDVLRILKEQET